MIRHHEGCFLVCQNAATELCQAFSCSQQILGRRQAEAENQFRFDKLDLLPEIWNAVTSFLGQGLPVPRGSAFQDVTDIHFLTPEMNRFEDLVQQLACSANERFALRIFICARCFSNQHQCCTRVAHTEYKLRPRMSEGALDAAVYLLFHCLKCGRGAPRFLCHRLFCRPRDLEQQGFFLSPGFCFGHRGLLVRRRGIRQQGVAKQFALLPEEFLYDG